MKKSSADSSCVLSIHSKTGLGNPAIMYNKTKPKLKLFFRDYVKLLDK